MANSMELLRQNMMNQRQAMKSGGFLGGMDMNSGVMDPQQILFLQQLMNNANKGDPYSSVGTMAGQVGGQAMQRVLSSLFNRGQPQQQAAPQGNPIEEMLKAEMSKPGADWKQALITVGKQVATQDPKTAAMLFSEANKLDNAPAAQITVLTDPNAAGDVRRTFDLSVPEQKKQADALLAQGWTQGEALSRTEKEPYKIGEVKEFQEQNQNVYKRWNGTDWEPMKGVGGSRVQQTQDVGLSTADASHQRDDFDTQMGNADSAITMIGNIRKTLNDPKEKAPVSGWPAAISRGISQVVSTGKWMIADSRDYLDKANEKGFTVGDLVNEKNYGAELTKFKATPAAYAARSRIIQLAYMMAVAKQGSAKSISDKDVKFMMETIGESISDPKSFDSVLVSLNNDIIQGLRSSGTYKRALVEDKYSQDKLRTFDNRVIPEAGGGPAPRSVGGGGRGLTPAEQAEINKVLYPGANR